MQHALDAAFRSAFNILEPDPDGSQIPVHPDDRDALRDFQDALQQTKRVAEMRLCDVDGLYRWYRIEASNIMDDSGWPIYVIGIITDIDNQKNLELTLRNQAARDSATGMYNKLATEQAIARFLDRHNLDGAAGGYALFMIDFDNFKIINDRLGHAVGDQAICAMARIIRQNFRSADIVGRIGGDEFLVFCTERLSMLHIRKRAAKLGGELRTEWGEGENRCVLTASMGVACAPATGAASPELYQHADEATYQAKHMGKNGCVFYAEMREAGALPPPAGASVVNANIDAAPDVENGRGCRRSIGPDSGTGARIRRRSIRLGRPYFPRIARQLARHPKNTADFSLASYPTVFDAACAHTDGGVYTVAAPLVLTRRVPSHAPSCQRGRYGPKLQRVQHCVADPRMSEGPQRPSAGFLWGGLFDDSARQLTQA